MAGGIAQRVPETLNDGLRWLVFKRDGSISTAVLVLPVVIVGVFAISPIVIAVISSFRISLPGEVATWGLSGWIDAFSSRSIWASISNTFILALMRVPLAVAVGAYLAWLLIRTNIPGRGTFEFMFWIAFFLPSLPMAMAWAILFDPSSGWVNLAAVRYFGFDEAPFDIFTYVGITWVHLTASTVPVMIILMGPAFRSLDSEGSAT